MKNIFRMFVIIAIVAVIGFGFVACDDGSGDDNGGGGGGGGTTTYSLDGVWKDVDGTIITINGSTGVFTQFKNNLNALWQSARSKGYISIGSPFLRNITKTGNLTWTVQVLMVTYNYSSPNVATGTTWSDTFTITMSADGQTLINSDDGTIAWTRQ